ncbi:MAG: riboflavin synthase [Actinomycetota bacterium]|nr:riboflavin synthase [Actinomycetota bacterium]
MMFTGIIEEVGRVEALRAEADGARIEVSCRLVVEGLRTGESICVNGVCLTAVEAERGGFTADISRESLDRSTLGRKRRGSPVNLERALSLGTRLGGHIVQGHVDGVGRTTRIEEAGNARVYVFSSPQELDVYLVEKGSIAVDGISLTISALEEGEFSVAVIPHTLEGTNLKSLRQGDEVNLETDIIAKYVMRFMSRGLPWPGNTGGDTGSLYEKLIEGGFV